VRKRGRVDNEQAAIVKALRDIGASVAVTSALGDGFPDLVTCWHGVVTLLEVKTGNAALTAAEHDFHARWGGDIPIVTTAEEAQRAVIGRVVDYIEATESGKRKGRQ
jgi:hypothetical protein